MDRNFFVLLSTQQGGAMPMTEDGEEMAFYATAEAARKDANTNPLGAAFGFEIFELGTGDT